MRRFIFPLIIALAAGSWGWSAENPSLPSDTQKFLQQLAIHLDHAAGRANQPGPGGASVVGVRGAEQKSGADLYWKNPETEQTPDPAEIKLFRTAVDSALAGKSDDAVKSLQAFKEKYPKSPLVPEVDNALQKLMSAAAAKPAS